MYHNSGRYNEQVKERCPSVHPIGLFTIQTLEKRVDWFYLVDCLFPCKDQVFRDGSGCNLTMGDAVGRGRHISFESEVKGDMVIFCSRIVRHMEYTSKERQAIDPTIWDIATENRDSERKR